ncbi:MAG TPA: helix-turn-helix transcriptional regulator [Spirochaetia bacterium]
MADETSYWDPFAHIIMESIESRHVQGISQSELASRMKTKQSVISRFENMGRLPNYDFVARLANALGHVPGMTLYGEFMAIVPLAMQDKVLAAAQAEQMPVQEFVNRLLILGIETCNRQVTNQAS